MDGCDDILIPAKEDPYWEIKNPIGGVVNPVEDDLIQVGQPVEGYLIQVGQSVAEDKAQVDQSVIEQEVPSVR